jgi:Ca2+-binding EF-hand superfamily protein
MKANIVRVMAVALIGLATAAVADSQAGDRFAVANGTVSRNTPVVDIAGTFRQLDRNGDGSLSLAEFEKVDRIIGRLKTTESGLPNQTDYVTRLGPFWSYSDLNNLFHILDSNRDGLLSEAEFAQINQVAVDFTGF